MQDTWFHPDIVDREFGSHLLHVPQFLEWLKSQNLVVPPFSRPIEDYEFVQVEMLLSAIANLSSVTPEQALAVVMTIPELSAHRLHDIDPDDEYIERVGKLPVRGDAIFARWQLGARASLAWRKLIAAGVRTQWLTLLDFASKLPIEQSEAIACCDLVVKPGQVPAVESSESQDARDKRRGTPKRWTDDELKRLVDYRTNHTAEETAAKFDISERRVRDLIADYRSAAGSHDAKVPTAHNPFGAKMGSK